MLRKIKLYREKLKLYGEKNSDKRRRTGQTFKQRAIETRKGIIVVRSAESEDSNFLSPPVCRVCSQMLIVLLYYNPVLAYYKKLIPVFLFRDSKTLLEWEKSFFGASCREILLGQKTKTGRFIDETTYVGLHPA